MVPVNCEGCGSINGISYVPRAWSAKGGLVAVEARSDSDPTRNGINVAPVDTFDSGEWTTQVTGAHEDTPLAFSPDGTQLLFVRHTTETGGQLWVVTLATTNAHRLSEAGEVVSADVYLAPGASWSADGKQVAYASTDASGSTANMRVSVVDAAGGPVTKITPATNFSTVAAWSPDGTWIAYDVDMDSGRHHVFVVHPDGSAARDLMPDASFGACCAHWSPDGTALVAPATTGADDESLLIVLPLDGSGIRQVTSVPALYTSVSWGAGNR
jgi:Tol biopolymer transport system component